MHKFVIAVFIATLTSPAIAADAPTTEEQKTLYAIGQTVYRSLAVFDLTPAELEIVKQGLAEAGAGKPQAVDPGDYRAKVQDLALSRRKAKGAKQAALYPDFLEKAAKEKGALKTDSGLVYRCLKEGSGTSPHASDTVKVNYRGTLPDGKEFDSSYQRGAPVEVRLDGVIKCWSEGLQKMKAGGKAELFCPPQLAYGDTGAGEAILPGAALAFEVELIEVKN